MAFPVKGIDLAMGFAQQRSGTTPTGQNVRAFEPGTARARGGARPGIAKYILGQINGNNPVQEINAIVATGFITGSGLVIPGSGNPTPYFYVHGTNWVALTDGAKEVWRYTLSPSGGTSQMAAIGGTVIGIDNCTGNYAIVSNGQQVASGALPATSGKVNDLSSSPATDGTDFYVVSADAASNITAIRVTKTGTVVWSNPLVSAGTGLATRPTRTLIFGGVVYTAFPSLGITQINATTGNALGTFLLASAAAITAAAPGYDALTGANNSGGIGLVNVGSTLAIGVQNPTTKKLGVVFVNTASALFTPAPLLNLSVPSTVLSHSLPTDGTSIYALVTGVLSGDAGYVIKINPTTGAIVWTSASITGVPNVIGYISALNVITISGGTSLSLDPATGAVTGAGLGAFYSGFADAGSVGSGSQLSDGGLASNLTNYSRAIILVGVSGGTAKVAFGGAWWPITNGAGLNTNVSVLRSAVNNGKLWFADGLNWKYYDPTDNTLHAWTVGTYQAGDTGGNPGDPKGALPVDSKGNAPRLIANWRGRLVLSGLPEDSANWFMSATNDARDFNYAPLSPTPTQAVAGNNAPQGMVGDIITALIPYTDDILIFGGDHSIYLMAGDPMAGGQIDLVSDIIGVAWGNAWCKGPDGAVYFVSNRCGIYKLQPGQQLGQAALNSPQRISQQIEQLLSAILIDQVVIRMAWDDANQGFHVFVTPFSTAQACVHFFYEARTGGWFTEVFANNSHNPLCCYSYFGGTAADRVALMGCWDGYVRAFTNSAPNDDGTAIASQVVLGPLLTKDLDDVIIKDIQAVLAAASADVTFSVYFGTTPEIALTSTPIATGTWSAGRNFSNYLRHAGHSIYVQIAGTSPWAMETIRARIAGLGKVRRRDGH